MTKQRMRRGEPAPSPDAVVLRGGGLDRDVLIADAETNFAVYGFYGLSVWVPADTAGEDALLATKLLKSRLVRRFLVADLLHAVSNCGTRANPHTTICCMSKMATSTPWSMPPSKRTTRH